MHLLNRFPRYPLLHGPTKIEPLTRLSALLNGPTIYVKRDDQNEMGGGGNKLRKLEFLLGDALQKQADTVITLGAWQSNHARLTAAASARAGLKCEIVLSNRVGRENRDYLQNGNILLNKIFGCNMHLLSKEQKPVEFAEERYKDLTAAGQNVYMIPVGGSNPIGILGYMRCAFEIDAQSQENGLEFHTVIVPNGSCGTQAGLVAGFRLLNKKPGTVMAYAVLNPGDIAQQQTTKLAQEAGQLVNENFELIPGDVNIDDSQLGSGYGIPTPAMIEAVELLARTEGLLIDPVYGGKAFAGLIAAIRQNKYQKHENVLFIMTGGLPGLYAYREIF